MRRFRTTLTVRECFVYAFSRVGVFNDGLPPSDVVKLYSDFFARRKTLGRIYWQHIKAHLNSRHGERKNVTRRKP